MTDSDAQTDQPVLNRLNLGCGNDIRPGWINLDSHALQGVDVVHDIEAHPLPFADGTFDEILAQDILEHVEYPSVLRELHRLLKTGGRLHVRVPHFTSVNNYLDPTHKKRFSVFTLDYFTVGAPHGRSYYFDFHFRGVAERRIHFPKQNLLYRALNGLTEALVNRSDWSRMFYENTGWSRLFPAENIEVVLIR